MSPLEFPKIKQVEKLIGDQIESILNDLRIDLNAWLEGFNLRMSNEQTRTFAHFHNLYEDFSKIVADTLFESKGQIPFLMEIVYNEFLLPSLDNFPGEARNEYLKYILFDIAQHLASKTAFELAQKS